MSRTPNKIIATLVAVLATAALAPAASAADTNPGERTQTELGQAVGEPTHDGNAVANARYSRTPTELGQRVTTPVVPALTSRTPTELGQRVATPVVPNFTSVASDAGASRFDWGDAAIGAAAMLGLIGFGAGLTLVLVNRRRHAIGDPGVPAVSS